MKITIFNYINMQKFQELLTEAAQLKQSQLKNQRKNYQSLPDYLKAGLNFTKKYKQLRQQNYLIQITMSEKLKKQGNNLFKNEQFIEALSKYEQALGIFRYIDTKSYDNMKDEDLIYGNYAIKEEDKNFQQQYKDHLTAVYLNICSCLTKLNKKEDSLHSVDQALKIQQTAKAYYKKAQCYLQYINKQTPDIKLGFYYLNKCYELSKDQAIIQQMHRIKKQIDEQRDKEKKWFKFMFDKVGQENTSEVKKIEKQKVKPIQLPIEREMKKQDLKLINLKSLERQRGNDEKEDERLQKTKEKLLKYANPGLTEMEWMQNYQGEFITKNGSKIYSIIQLYGYRQYLGEYKSLLAQCLQLKKMQSNLEKRKQMYGRYFSWLKGHPIDKIAKYVERYELQTQWIAEQRNNNNNKDKNSFERLEEQIVKMNANRISPELETYCKNQNINVDCQENNQQPLNTPANQQQISMSKLNEASTSEINEVKSPKDQQCQIKQSQQQMKGITQPKINNLKILIILVPFIIILVLTVKSLF